MSQVLESVGKKFENKEIDTKAYSTPDELHAFMDAVLENWDKEHVHNSDIKKIISWYNILVSNGITEYVAKKEEEAPAEDAPATEE